MRGDVLRWGLFLLSVLILVGIQKGVRDFFITGTGAPEITAHSVDLKAIENIWQRQVSVPKPEELVGPIQNAFDPTRGPISASAEAAEVGEEEATTLAGGLEVVMVIYRREGEGGRAALIEDGGRFWYRVGEELPNGQLLQSIEMLGPGEYEIRLKDSKGGKVSVVPFLGEAE